MLISIITPVYNREDCIKRAINSVKAIKIPKGYEYEHILIDDGSKDNTIKIIKQNKYSKLKLIELKTNKGVNGARNVGMKEAKGEYALFFDSDDELTTNTFQIIDKILKKTKKEFLVYLLQTKRYDNNKPMSYVKHPYKKITYKEYLEGSAVSGEFITLVHKKVYKKQFFDEKRFAFEAFYWNNAIKHFKSMVAIRDIIRIYHDEADNRLCKKLVDPKYARKRVQDYLYYLKTFEGDYKKLQLKSQLNKIYLTLAFFMALSKDKRTKKVLKKATGTKKAVLLIMLLFGRWPFRIVAWIYGKFA